MSRQVVVGVLVLLAAGCPVGPRAAPPPPVSLADALAAGRVHTESRYTNRALGIDLGLDRAAWRLVPYRADDLPRFVRLRAGGELSLSVVEVGAGESVAQATTRELRAAKSGEIELGALSERQETIAGWQVALGSRRATMTAAPYVGMRLLHEVAGVELGGGRVLRLKWLGPTDDDGPAIDWLPVLGALRRLGDGERVDGGRPLAEVLVSEADESRRLVDAGVLDAGAGVYANPALGLRCDAPGRSVLDPADPSALRTLFTVAASATSELPVLTCNLALVPVSAHPRWFIAPRVAEHDATAHIERLTIAGWRGASADLLVPHATLGKVRMAYLHLELGDRQLQWVHLRVEADAASPLPAMVSDLARGLN